MKSFKDEVSQSKRIVVKLGSSSLTHSNGNLDYTHIDHLVRQLADMKNMGKDVVLVSSGAIAAGMSVLGFEEKPKLISEKQACAAVGQGKLMHLYEKFFQEYGYQVAQLLLTKDDLNNRKRFMNARNSIEAILKFNVIPIINENDAVAVDEIRVGDNDTLSALVASFVEADLLIILSDIDGLFDRNPQKNPDAHLIPIINDITPQLYDISGGVGSKVGTGGMLTKITAAKIATSSGIPMIIANSHHKNVLIEILKGRKKGTFFRKQEQGLNLKRKWIAYNSVSRGNIYIDSGAEKAIFNNKSLLPSGVISVKGRFERGDIVSVIHADRTVAKGMIEFSEIELKKIMGKKSNEIEDTLGYHASKVVIHVDNMAHDI